MQLTETIADGIFGAQTHIVFTGGPPKPGEHPIRLTEWRELRGLSQRALADRSGVSPTTINEIETGKRIPRISTMRRLASALETDDWQLHNHPRDEYSGVAQFARAVDRLDSVVTSLMASGQSGDGFAMFVAHHSDWFEGEDADYSARGMWALLADKLPWMMQFWHQLNRQLFEQADFKDRSQMAWSLDNWRSDWEAAGLGDIQSGMAFRIVNETEGE